MVFQCLQVINNISLIFKDTVLSTVLDKHKLVVGVTYQLHNLVNGIS